MTRVMRLVGMVWITLGALKLLTPVTTVSSSATFVNYCIACVELTLGSRLLFLQPRRLDYYMSFTLSIAFLMLTFAPIGIGGVSARSGNCGCLGSLIPTTLPVKRALSSAIACITLFGLLRSSILQRAADMQETAT